MTGSGGGYGIVMGNAQATAVTGNRVTGHHQSIVGVYAVNSTGGTVANNFLSLRGEGIRLNSSGNYVIANNTVSTGQHGIAVTNSPVDNQIVNNTITTDGANAYGITVVSSSVDLVGNSIDANGISSNAIFGSVFSTLKIAENTIWANAAAGIYLGGMATLKAGSTGNVSQMSPATRCGGASGGVPIIIGFDDGTCIIP